MRARDLAVELEEADPGDDLELGVDGDRVPLLRGVIELTDSSKPRKGVQGKWMPFAWMQ